MISLSEDYYMSAQRSQPQIEHILALAGDLIAVNGMAYSKKNHGLGM